MLSARVRDQIRVTSRRLTGGLSAGALARALAERRLQAAFLLSFVLYLLIKVIDLVLGLPGGPLWELTLVPAFGCGLAISVRASQRSDPREGALGTRQDSLELPGWAARLALVLLLVFTAVFVELNTRPVSSSPDESAALAAGEQLIHGGSLRSQSPLNARYNTNIIGNAHAIYKSPNEAYYKVLPGTALLIAPFALLSHDTTFRLATGLVAVATIGAICWLGTALLRSRLGGLLAGALFVTSPVFAHWSATLQNNVFVLAFELGALALVLWAGRERPLLLSGAGALIGLAAFVRITELVYILPMVALVVWRYRSVRHAVAFSLPAAAAIAAIFITNAAYYGDPIFTPYAGAGYIFPHSFRLPAIDIQQRYVSFASGSSQSSTSFAVSSTARHLIYHVHFLASSIFAFPFLAVALAGIVWRLVERRRNSLLLAAAVAAAAAIVLLIYGRQANNYVDYGQAVVRNSFIRYSLPVYSLLAIAAAGFLLEAAQQVWERTAKLFFVVGLAAAAMTVGVGQSYDWTHYGLNRLNEYREQDGAAWAGIAHYLDTRPATPLLIGGASSEKLVNDKYHAYFIDYHSLPAFGYALIPAVAQKAAPEREVYVILSDGSPSDRQFQNAIYLQYRPQAVLHTGVYRVERLSLAPAMYTLTYVDVWNTYAAIDRWAVTPDGMLQAALRNAYIQLPPVDADGDGRVDQDLTVLLEVQDTGPAKGAIYGIDSRTNEPVALWQALLHQTPDWLTVTVTLHQGDYLTDQLTPAPGLTFRAIGIAAAGSQ